MIKVKTLKILVSAALFIFIVAPTYAARTNCPSAKILNIQVEGKKILYLQEGAPWRALGYINKKDGTEERYSALLTAQATGRKVQVAYPVKSFNCSKVNYGTSAYLVKTFNN